MRSYLLPGPVVALLVAGCSAGMSPSPNPAQATGSVQAADAPADWVSADGHWTTPSCGNGCDSKCVDGSRYEQANGVVYDQTRDIFWQGQAGPQMVFADAVSYCANLSLGGANRGWRLPGYEELANLLYMAGSLHAGSAGSCTPAIDQAAFPATAIDYHWMDGNAGPRPQAINFFDGREHALFADTLATVRCIHDPVRSQ